MANAPKLINESLSFEGTVGFYSHDSSACNSEMKFAIYQPPQAKERPLPILYFLSGLTCTEENFMVKAGAQRLAAHHGLILVTPDTSPRQAGIKGEDDSWDFGTGAGFYVDATNQPWNTHYRMYTYITEELPTLIGRYFPVNADRQGIFGHSMGGHGALVCALRNPDRYRSVSAFAPICAPMQCPWGQKAFSHYLGSDQTHWRDYDASELVRVSKFHSSILIDQGTYDQFLTSQLLPDVFKRACDEANQSLTLRLQAGYDHSYYFIATFIEDHMHHHAIALYA
ncbi:MAG: S-formylglutathione hydrolase [Myxacorys chilensis ATA2-1-KO14]|jgi:S-formylglutathione hydrolase|nr:S-formylglutathione hydrolase [Myxacorys chilensis ATA2-1-KO14]